MKSAPSETVTLWSTVQGRQEEAREDDSSVARSAVAGLPAAASGNVELVAGYVPPLKAIEAAAGCRAIVTMRLHPALFAAASGTPFGLVLDGQRTEVLADTPLAGRVASPHDRAAIAAVIGRAVGGQDDEDFWESLGPLRARLADVGRRLGVWLAAVTPGGGG